MKSLLGMTAVMTAGAALIAGAALAQPAKNSKAPFDVTADQMETHTNDCVVIATGSAEALRDTSRLRADVMIAHLEMTKGKQPAAKSGEPTSSCGAMTSLEAKGNVYYVSGDGRRVHGDNGFYDSANTTVTITGDVTAVDASNNVMRGTKMVYNTQSGEGHMEGSGKGVGAKNRPRGVFYPKDSDETAQSGDQGQSDQGKGKTKKAAK